MKYRPDIDGLRAVAVLAVLLDHAGAPGFSGGYIGVDVFFVISGYLITRLLADELQSGRFSLAGFYERRCRRILPPLFLVLLAASVVSWCALMPFDSRSFGRSLTATSTFWVNIHFFRQTGYFDAQTYTKPLLHCWSLSVEEQFYILFPLLLWLLSKLGRKFLRPALALVAVASLAASIAQVGTRPEMAFYWTHTRAWELLLGALTALSAPAFLARFRSAGLALASAGLMLAPVFIYGPQTPFPGLAALPVCLGAALLLLIHRDGPEASLVGRALALAPSRWIGKISYSLYLWHWPLLVMPRYIQDEPLSPASRLAAVAAAFALAWLSWRYIEKPTRERRFFPTRRSLFAAALIGIALFTLAGRVIRHTNGLPALLNPKIELWAQEAARNQQVDEKPLVVFESDQDGEKVEILAWPLGPEGEARFVVWGDSHVGMWRTGLQRSAMEAGTPGLETIPTPCPVLHHFRGKLRGVNCEGVRRGILEMVKFKGIKKVLVATRYSVMFPSPPLTETSPAFAAPENADPRVAADAFVTGLADLVASFNQAGAEVWFIENVPEYPFHVTNRVSREALRGHSPADSGYPVRYYQNRNAEPRRLLRSFQGPGFKLLSVEESLCPDGWCLPGDDQYNYYTDDNHLSGFGATRFRGALAPFFQSLAMEETAGAGAGPAR
ncbi:MAG: acyltransferase [Deltaproteobacteria bacterium]|jgi:peptidoglycan/LPS O-acetylase OafA/YrhL|nr:acyltransferase [Deltaproteobacteria bacterium]